MQIMMNETRGDISETSRVQMNEARRIIGQPEWQVRPVMLSIRSNDPGDANRRRWSRRVRRVRVEADGYACTAVRRPRSAATQAVTGRPK